MATKSIVLSLLNANAKAKIQMQLIDLGNIPERNWKGEWGDQNRQPNKERCDFRLSLTLSLILQGALVYKL